MTKRILEKGDVFGNLVVQGESYMHVKNRKYLCKCLLCGVEDYFFGNNLKKGNTTKCKGCAGDSLSQQMAEGLIPVPHNPGTLGGLSYTTQYRAYRAMLNRCYNPNYIQYTDYGGRGIRVCDRWRESYLNFLEDMGERPPGCSIDRLNVNGDYCKENCKWSTQKEQCRNKRETIFITVGGIEKPMAAWAEELSVKHSYLAKRRQMGYNMEELILNLQQKE